VSAGQLWRRADRLLWVELQAAGVDGSGWRLMVPLVAPDQAVPAPPLVVPVDRWLARVHLATGVPERVLGEPAGALPAAEVAALRDALAALVARPA
jgi:hypothetical protein